MNQACPSPGDSALTAAPRVSYGTSLPTALAAPNTLAAFSFDTQRAAPGDPRHLRVPLGVLGAPHGAIECWQVDDTVIHGREGELAWASGGGWLFVAMDVNEADHGGVAGAAEQAYAQLCAFLARHPAGQVQRLWNYLGQINTGDGDHERYKRFCDGRAQGMGAFFADGFPAATAVGHHAGEGWLQVYCLAALKPGTRLENPRQVAAWQYPRQYGPTPPSFARAMRLPGGDLAISGTASIIGHQSQHVGQLEPQLDEILANLQALLAHAGSAPGFDEHSPLKVYVRHPEQTQAIDDYLARHLPETPRLLLHGDICRAELLVEIDGWRY